jgi:hypothetical protein
LEQPGDALGEGSPRGKENVALNINYRAIVAAAVAAFLIGALWYSPLLFGNEYMSY